MGLTLRPCPAPGHPLVSPGVPMALMGTLTHDMVAGTVGT